jgi:hypothetical protein
VGGHSASDRLCGAAALQPGVVGRRSRSPAQAGGSGLVGIFAMTRHSACCPAVRIFNFLCKKLHIDLWHVIDVET